jgi:hypothetical protein
MVPWPLIEQGDAVHVRHPDVQQHQVGARTLTRGSRLAGVLGQLHGVALVGQDLRQERPDAEFVIHYKNR